jgi:hypothetical protein
MDYPLSSPGPPSSLSTMLRVALLIGVVVLVLRSIQVIWVTHTKTHQGIKRRKDADKDVALAVLLGSGLFPRNSTRL